MVSKANSLLLNQPSLFRPTVIRGLVDDANGSATLTKDDYSAVESTALGTTSSFRYDLPNTGIKSTQQLNIDWSDFANHTFFNSAQVKTNASFEKIINTFPFDGTKKQLETFFDKLTGFEKYVFDNFPKHNGYLFLSGTSIGEASGGTYVTAKDIAGADYPYITKNPDGSSILNPESNSMTVEFYVYLPTMSSSNQWIFNKVNQVTTNNYHGFGAMLYATGSIASASLQFAVMSGNHVVSTQTNLTKGQWNHVAWVWDRNVTAQSSSLYINQQLVASSSAVEIGTLNFNNSSLYIGSGSAITTLGFTPQTTMSGAIDELRIWHTIRDKQQRAEMQKRNVYAEDNLKLYYRFNETSGSGSPVVLDHSGNGLHGTIAPQAFYTLKVRDIASGSVAGPAPLTLEKLNENPILFPEYEEIDELRAGLLQSAGVFDDSNPNHITKLIPAHFLLEGSVQDGLATEEGDILDDLLTLDANPGNVKMGQTQALLMLLYTWAKYFDELKLFIQAFGDIGYVDYDSNDNVPDAFLQQLAERFGIELPPLFVGTSINQYINGNNLENETSTNPVSLQYIQNQIWRRVLINLKDVISSKGTIHSIKSFIRSVGIDPDNNFRIREFGGPTKKQLQSSREFRSEVSTMLDFSNGGLLTSNYMSSSRVEPGYPQMVGNTVNNPNSNKAADGLWTSGSFTYEFNVRYPRASLVTSNTQSLFRLNATGSQQSVLANLVAVTGSGVTLYLGPTPFATGVILKLTGVDIFDSNVWTVSFGRSRGDDQQVNSYASSSYFLRLARQNYGDLVEEYVTSSYYYEGTGSLFTNTSSLNTMGPFFTVGSQSLPQSNFLFQAPYAIPELYETRFSGRMGHIKFWTKTNSITEFREHAKNFKSNGVKEPDVNFSFVTNAPGSWERFRTDLSTDQMVTQSNGSGVIVLQDFSQNNIWASGTNFPLTASVIKPQRYYYSFISPYFDEGSTTNKVRVRSYQNFDNVINGGLAYSQVAPIYDIEPSEVPTDNTRFSIDFSVVDALNQDIMTIFGSLDYLENAIGNPELVFSGDYPDLETLRNIYFNRLTSKMNLKSFFEFFKWFDTNIGNFITQLVPRKTKYLGVNFTVESHMLERPRFEYQYAESYLGQDMRHSMKDSIFLQFFIGTLGRY